MGFGSRPLAAMYLDCRERRWLPIYLNMRQCGQRYIILDSVYRQSQEYFHINFGIDLPGVMVG